jgi:hypothetical protein
MLEERAPVACPGYFLAGSSGPGAGYRLASARIPARRPRPGGAGERGGP